MIALITGASTGIGYELAQVFAKNKYQVILVARSKDKLEQLAAELSAKYPTAKPLIFAVDLSDMEQVSAFWQKIQNAQLSIDVLVNNAGFGDYGEFKDSDIAMNVKMIDLNIKALTMLTHYVLPQMLQRRQGKILQVASVAAFQPGPMMAVYFATKAYVLHFSEAIAEELRGTGVTITALCPGPTESHFAQNAQADKAQMFNKKLPTSLEVAEYGFRATMKGKRVAIHGFMNAFLAFVVRLTPRSLVTQITKMMMS